MAVASHFLALLPPPLVGCCFGLLKYQKEGRKEKTEIRMISLYSKARSFLSLSFLLALLMWQRHNCWLFLLWALWRVPWRFTAGDLFLKFPWDRRCLLALAIGWPHHHSRQTSWDGSLLRWPQAGPSIRPLSSLQKYIPWLATGGTAATDSVHSVLPCHMRQPLGSSLESCWVL